VVEKQTRAGLVRFAVEEDVPTSGGRDAVDQALRVGRGLADRQFDRLAPGVAPYAVGIAADVVNVLAVNGKTFAAITTAARTIRQNALIAFSFSRNRESWGSRPRLYAAAADAARKTDASATD